ncbi:AP2/ERF and B3 domain-containing transcription factor At1g51120-like [Phalaenopsis equestris]|uniref:AP2/ERF and B3 domain-containing transcription factor At1g51120-like n=1 Tax=Phalaenopsis equestris TaxID=78828 RepID=UPI0009E570CA|nr:AP2/ERF and B3 domain-containing transcription factor At1g51120-like [Phalaenopsis equestris]
MSSSPEDPSYEIPLTPGEQQVSTLLLSRYDGVVPQQNGLWCAQIYNNHYLKLLGTFKSEISAARAYDSAARKLCGSDFFRNLFLTNVTIHEPNFQSMYTNEAVIDMIRDGSYEPKFIEFVWIHHPNFSYSGFVAWPTALDTIPGNLFKEMFHKELILTDMENKEVLVLPYQALFYFPPLNSKTVEVWLEFKDRRNQKWAFKYCYRSNNHSYVLTAGWDMFANEMQLCVDDIVVFYRCRDWKKCPIKILDVVDIIRGVRNTDKQWRLGEAYMHAND